MTKFYPVITEATLTSFRALRKLIDEDPGYLSHPECPYAPDTKLFLSTLFVGSTLAPEDVVSLETPEDLQRELAKAFSSLQMIEKSLQKSDVADRLQWMKASVGILDRVVSLQERTLTLKRLSEFQRAVLSALDEVLEPHQRTQFIERLKSL